MSENSIQKRLPNAIKDKTQYVLAFGVIASMLVVANIPVLVVFFFGVFAYLVVKMLASGTRSETREVFEFYLAANEMLRDDDRKWFGFELKEVINRGEGILQRMSAVPPLIYFTLGALYNKAGDHSSAEKHLANVVERPGADESAYVFPTPELRNYVKILRKIEREPADAPLTSAAVRSLERSRKLRAKSMLEECRRQLAKAIPEATEALADEAAEAVSSVEDATPVIYSEDPEADAISADNDEKASNGQMSGELKQDGKRPGVARQDPFSNRKPISEVLHDIYDSKVQ